MSDTYILLQILHQALQVVHGMNLTFQNGIALDIGALTAQTFHALARCKLVVGQSIQDKLRALVGPWQSPRFSPSVTGKPKSLFPAGLLQHQMSAPVHH